MTELEGALVQRLEDAFDLLVAVAQHVPRFANPVDDELLEPEVALRGRAYRVAAEYFGEGRTIADRIEDQLAARALGPFSTNVEAEGTPTTEEEER